MNKANPNIYEYYEMETEPEKREKGYAWHTAIGLQAVDGLNTSEYLIHTAIRNIEGEITFEEANALLQNYYNENPTCDPTDRTEEADKVSAKIAQLLSEKAFSFTPNEYISIHRKLFTGIYSHAGEIRNYNISKKEWVLNGATVLYGSASELKATLDYDFSEEKKFSYKGLSMDETIHHLAEFISGLWQIHVFSEGNTRTTAVFLIKYLRKFGFDVTNDIFAENAWYFRNSLVRANYNDIKHGIHETTEFLEIFLRNLLLNENHPLLNRTLHISGKFKRPEKPDIEGQKPDIGIHEPDFSSKKTGINNAFSAKTSAHIQKLSNTFGYESVFGRSDIEKELGLKSSRCSELLSEMLKHGIIEPVRGLGKGKYKFSRKRKYTKAEPGFLKI